VAIRWELGFAAVLTDVACVEARWLVGWCAYMDGRGGMCCVCVVMKKEWRCISAVPMLFSCACFFVCSEVLYLSISTHN